MTFMSKLPYGPVDPAWILRAGTIPDHESEDGWLFPDGTRSSVCTNWAVYVRRALGPRAQIWGFFCEDNPRATGMAALAEGHDFAVLDERWILDGWMMHVAGVFEDPIIDMQDRANHRALEVFYGERRGWERNLHLERCTDMESACQRSRAMAGVGAKGSAAIPPPHDAQSRQRLRSPISV